MRINSTPMRSQQSHSLNVNKSKENPGGKHTKVLAGWNTRPSYCASALIIFLLFLQTGLFSAAFGIQIDLKAAGSTEEQQSLFFLYSLGFNLKIFLIPFIDFYYFKSFGRSKTYMLISGLSSSLLLIFFSFTIENDIKELKVVKLTLKFFTLAFLNGVFEVAIGSWALTLLEEEKRAKGGFFMYLGNFIGGILGFNGYLLFTDKKFFNQYLFQDDPLENSVLSSSTIFLILGIIYLTVVLFASFFVPELIIEIEEESKVPKLKKMWIVMKNLFLHKKWRKFLILIIMTRALPDLGFGIQFLQLFELGMDKSIYSMVDLGSKIIGVAGLPMASCYSVKGKILFFFFLTLIFIFFDKFLKAILIYKLEKDNREFIGISWALLLVSCSFWTLGWMHLSSVFSFLNLNSDEVYSATIYNIVSSIYHIVGHGFEALGPIVVKWLGYNLFQFLWLVVFLFVLVYSYFECEELDRVDPKDFVLKDIIEGEVRESGYEELVEGDEFK